MKGTFLLLAGLLMAAPLAAEEAGDGRACEQQQDDCATACGDEKFLAFIRTAGYDRCMLRCRQASQACAATLTDTDEFEVIRARNDVREREEPVPEPVERQEMENGSVPPPADRAG